MADEFPDYELLGPVGPHDADPEAEAFYQTQIWLHRPCGIVAADRQAHDSWHAGLVQEIRAGIREAQRHGGWGRQEQIR